MNGRQKFQSFSSDFARSESESQFPGLWKGLETIYSPSLGVNGNRLIDYKQKLDITFDNDLPVWDNGVNNGSSILFNGSLICSSISRTWGFSVDCSICAWIKTTTSGLAICSLGHDASDDEAMIYVSGGGNGAIFNHNSPGNYSVKESDSSVITDKWIFVVGCINGSYNSLKIFINGREEAGSYSEAGTPSDISDSTERILKIGGRTYVTGGENFIGNIGDVLVYSRVLKPQEITQLYLGQTPLVKRVRKKMGVTPTSSEFCFGQNVD